MDVDVILFWIEEICKFQEKVKKTGEENN